MLGRERSPSSSVASRLASLALGLSLAAGLQGCGGYEADPLEPRPVTRLEVLGAPGGSLTLTAGSSQEVDVAALDSGGADVHSAVITAASSDETVATVSGEGPDASRVRLAHTAFEILGVAPGTATITFTHAESGSGAGVTVTVTP